MQKINKRSNIMDLDYDDSGKRILNRRAQYCQFRIQQAISLIDDEIGRLLQRLKMYNSQILEYKDKFQDLENKIQSAKISQDGFYKMRTADLKTSISRLKARQFQQIQEIKQSHSLELESMQRDFETILRNFNKRNASISANDIKMLNQKYLEQEKAIQNEIDIYKSKIQTYNEAIQQQEKQMNSTLDETDNFYEEINSSVVLELTRTIEERSKERYQSLIDSKSKLKECVEQMETMDRQHKLKINELADEISSIDNEYHKTLSELNEKHEIQIINLKNHLSEAEKREKVLTKAAQKLELENQKQLKNTKMELQKMEENIKFKKTSKSLNDSQDSNYYNQLKELKSDLKRLLKRLRAREEQLKEKREENQVLKRKIGSLKHDIRFSGRMVGSVYPYRSFKNNFL